MLIVQMSSPPLREARMRGDKEGVQGMRAATQRRRLDRPLAAPLTFFPRCPQLESRPAKQLEH